MTARNRLKSSASVLVLLGEDQADEKKMAAGFNWFLVLSSVFLCNLVKTLLPSISSFVSTDSKWF